MQKSIKSFDNTKIVYEINKVGNSKPVLVFLHGAGGDYGAWKKELSFFSKKKYSTLAIDLRGHGLSGRPKNPKDYELSKFAKDVNEVLEKEKINRSVLIGHCFGGMIVMNFHKLFPRKAKAYVLIDTNYKSPRILSATFKNTPFLTNLANKLLSKINHEKEGHVNFDKFTGTGDWNPIRIYSDIANTSLKSWFFTYQHIANFDGKDILKKIKKPVLVIHGEKDSVFKTKIGEEIHKLVSKSKFKIIPNANHIIVLNNPSVIEKELYDFVEKL